jgi:polysaccharide biosynthesis/export protein
MRIPLAAILFLFIVTVACNPTKRATYNYLEDVNDTTFKKAVYMAEPIIQKTDLLSIQVYSASTDPKVDQLYNLPALSTATQANTQLQGYLVDQQGNIEMPRIGVLHAEGLTKRQLSEQIKAKLQGQLTDPSVIIRFLSFKVTVLGEVGTPGVLNVQTERLNILEAVGMAGGVTEFGKIKQVKVLREEEGNRELGVLDLTSKSIFQSRFFQLQQNDIVMVDKTAYKLRQTEQQRVTQQIGFALTIITTLTLIYSIFKK